jgi:hypothetical protein
MITTMKKNEANTPLFSGEHNIHLHVNFENNEIEYKLQGNPHIHEYLLFKLATQEPHFAAALLHAAKNFIEYRSKYC